MSTNIPEAYIFQTNIKQLFHPLILLTYLLCLCSGIQDTDMGKPGIDSAAVPLSTASQSEPQNKGPGPA